MGQEVSFPLLGQDIPSPEVFEQQAEISQVMDSANSSVCLRARARITAVSFLHPVRSACPKRPSLRRR
jgi:hypothetical protein